MKTVAVTAEFNPFHNGHKYLAEYIRKTYGPDTAIVCLMSGSFVQRGDVAVADPYFRAKTALLSGYDLILELPFPYCCSGAESFTRASIRIMNALGCVDAVAFGCESGDLSILQKAERIASDPETEIKFNAIRKTSEGKKSGTSELFRTVLQETIPEVFDNGIGPNDLLAIGYLRALKECASEIEPLAVPRIGGRYESTLPDHPEFIGATASRTLLKEQKINDFCRYIPAETHSLWKTALKDKSVPASFSPRLSDAVLAFLIASDPRKLERRSGIDGGFCSRLITSAKDAVSFDELLSRTSCRSLSYSQIRRMILALWLGVTSSQPSLQPTYTRIFGFTDRGQELLRTVKRTSTLPVLTKTADWKDLPEESRCQAEFSLSADRFFGFALPHSRPASDAYRGVPCHITGNQL